MNEWKAKESLHSIMFWGYFQIWAPYSFNSDSYDIIVTGFSKELLDIYTH